MILWVDQKEGACVDVINLLQIYLKCICLICIVASALSIWEEPTFDIELVINIDLILDHSVDLTLVFKRIIFNYLLYQGLLVPHRFCGDGHVIIEELERMVDEGWDRAVSLSSLYALADRFPSVSTHHVSSIPWSSWCFHISCSVILFVFDILLIKLFADKPICSPLCWIL